ncbi:glycosyltransferase family 4 protein [Massilia varians]
MAKQSILIIHHGQGVGGGLIALIGLIAELRENYRVDVFSIFDSDAVQYLRDAGVNVYLPVSDFYRTKYSLFIHSDAAFPNPIDFVRNLRAFSTFLSSRRKFAAQELARLGGDYDLVYLNSAFISDFGYAAKALGKRVMVHVREPISKGLSGLRYKVIKNTIATADHVIAVSEDNATRLDLRGRTSVVYDPVVVRGAKAGKHEADGLKYFLYLGGEARIKGFEPLVNALPYLDRNVRILFLGGQVAYAQSGLKSYARQLLDPFARRRKKLQRALKSSDRVVHVGLTDDVFKYYEMCTGVICAFTKPHACLPVLEAFAVGKPVVTSDVVGMDELVDETTGFFFKNGDPRSLAKQVNRVANMSDQALETMRRACESKYRSIRSTTPHATSVVSKVLAVE